ncbi:oxidoreductase [Paenibacillus athensensis]|uniref:NAD(P)-binding domain-containing protein n=1 Tax=Paenibacillus athensensis TaxID=1967502 RepID=A0A4Y8Q0B6_9BACL|nr:oxidoreductase [Paenibacillus athensensis]MCD1261105.1 oxidoreductase [Paenibacillus athensensis]
MEPKKTAIVAGATGLVGRALVERLVQDGGYADVFALVRKPGTLTPHRNLTEVQVDYERLEETPLPWETQPDVFCALGTTIKTAGSQAAFRRVDFDYPLALGKLARRREAARFLIVSAMGASSASRIFYSRVKGETETGLREMDWPGLYIFRPSLLLGRREEYRAGERFATVVMGALNGLLVGPLRKYRGIAAADVARAMVYAAQAGPPGTHIYESDRIQRLADASRNN